MSTTIALAADVLFSDLTGRHLSADGADDLLRRQAAAGTGFTDLASYRAWRTLWTAEWHATVAAIRAAKQRLRGGDDAARSAAFSERRRQGTKAASLIALRHAARRLRGAQIAAIKTEG